MNLDESHRTKVAAWIGEGLKISDIQNRLATEFGLRMTYMDVRLLVDDLKLTPRDVEPPKPDASALPQGAIDGKSRAPTPGQSPGTAGGETSPVAGKLSLSVDQITRPGAVVSGKVTFSDGNQAEWYFDETGRLGLLPRQAGYRPAGPDLQQFQAALDRELSKLGF